MWMENRELSTASGVSPLDANGPGAQDRDMIFLLLRRACLLVAGFIFLTDFAAVQPAQSSSTAEPQLRVTADHHHLEFTDGRPFFYLGDTAWMLLARASREETDRYLTNRAAKGFTVIQTVVIAPEGGLTVPNAEGDLPLINGDLARPNERYFQHVDYVVQRVAQLGLFVGLLPTWGQYWKQEGKQQPLLKASNADAFGRFLGSRYRSQPVIWILGGDQDITSPQERAVVDALARGLKEGDGGTHLITYHPRGPGFSFDSLPDSAWLDFHMVQSSHGARDHDNGLFAEHDYALTPPKPTLDGEPRYECMPVGFYYQDASRLDRFDDYDVRQAAYWSLLAGACGHTYGNNNVWQCWQPGREPVLWANQAWQDALDTAGAFQMGHVRRLFESRPFNKLVPNQAMILDGPRNGGAKVRAASAKDGSFAFIYSPRGESFTVDKSVITAPRMREIWYDPRYGVAYDVHTTSSRGIQTYAPPTSGRGQDWLLIIEDVTKNFPLPGTPKK